MLWIRQISKGAGFDVKGSIPSEERVHAIDLGRRGRDRSRGHSDETAPIHMQALSVCGHDDRVVSVVGLLAIRTEVTAGEEMVIAGENAN